MCFTFVCGHVGIYGKEQADYLAKNATKKNINADANVPKSYLKNIFNLKQLKNGIISILLQIREMLQKSSFQLFLKELNISIWYSVFMLRNF